MRIPVNKTSINYTGIYQTQTNIKIAVTLKNTTLWQFVSNIVGYMAC